MLKIKDFTIEYRTNPLGFDEQSPRFSWKLITDKKDVLQSSYRLSVYDDRVTVWDSGVKECGCSLLVPYGGGAFKAQTEYKAIVEVEDNKGETASTELKFETGLLKGSAFKGIFIAPCLKEQAHVWVLGTKFTTIKPVKKARLYATALGMYKAEINGKKAGDLFFAPFWTSYNKTLQYQTYDVTDLIAAGRNEISLTIANGWYRGRLGITDEYFKGWYGDTSAALAELHIFYDDGTKDVVATDKAWTAGSCHIMDSEIYDGETQDFTRDLFAPFSVKEIEYNKNKIVAQMSEPCRVIEKIKPVKYLVTPLGEKVLDFGQNLSGLVEFTIDGKKGQTVELKHAEVLDKEGNFYIMNLRRAKATDTFILSGGKQTLHAEFTFHGFRFLKITGIDNIDPEDFTALVIHSDLKKTGKIVTSDPEVNCLLSNIEWGQRDNFVDVPMDCPQRDERLGWTGDANVFFGTAAYQYDVALFFKKWLNDLTLDQTADGGVPWVIPNFCGWNGAFDALWSDAATMIPYNMYKVYGDPKILETQYASMKAFADGVATQCSDEGIIVKGHQFGDWVALDKDEFMDGYVGPTDIYFLANAFYIISLRILVETAKILNNKADADKYTKRLAAVQKAFLKEYVTATGRLVPETQTSCALALYFDLVPKKFHGKITAALKHNFDRRRGKLAIGFIGAPYLCFALSDNGLHEYAEKILLSREYPGWLYPVTMGATTVWERWNGIYPNGDLYCPDMNSFNHYAYGSVAEYYYRRIAGIELLEPGFKKIKIKPVPVNGLPSVAAEYNCAYGLIKSAYEIRDGKMRLTVEIPANTTAKVILPDGKNKIIGSGKYEFEATISK